MHCTTPDLRGSRCGRVGETLVQALRSLREGRVVEARQHLKNAEKWAAHARSTVAKMVNECVIALCPAYPRCLGFPHTVRSFAISRQC